MAPRTPDAGLAFDAVAPAAQEPPPPNPQTSRPDDPDRRPQDPPSQEQQPGQPGAAGSIPGADTAAAANPSAKPWIRGQLDTRYRGRWADGANDHDLYGTLSLDFGDAAEDRVTGHVMGRLSWDVDGAEAPASVFYSLADTWNDDLVGYLYDAYLDLNRIDGLSIVRVGRQPMWDTPEFVLFDGARVESAELGGLQAKAGVYGGLSTHLYESSRRGDWTLGAFAQVRPWQQGRVRIDWMHLEDEARLGDHQDDLFGVALWQRLGERWRVEGRYTRIESRDRDLRALLGYTLAERDLTATATYYQLLRTQRSLVLELDPFFESLREYRPFWQLGLAVSKGIVEHVRLDLGADLRRVTHAADEGTFNRDYERYYATAALEVPPVPGLTVGVTADLWRSGSQDVSGWGIDLTQQVGEAWRASVGTYYSLYKYDLFFDRESNDVRTYFARLRCRLTGDLSASLAYEFEDNDLDRFHSLRADVTWRF